MANRWPSVKMLFDIIKTEGKTSLEKRSDGYVSTAGAANTFLVRMAWVVSADDAKHSFGAIGKKYWNYQFQEQASDDIDQYNNALDRIFYDDDTPTSIYLSNRRDGLGVDNELDDFIEEEEFPEESPVNPTSEHAKSKEKLSMPWNLMFQESARSPGKRSFRVLEMSLLNSTPVQLKDIFEPTIRLLDIPERVRIAITALANANPGEPLLSTEELEIEFLQKDLQGFSPLMKGHFLIAVKDVLDLFLRRYFEVPFVFMHRQDYITYHEPRRSDAPEKSIQFFTSDELYIALIEQKMGLKRLFDKLGVSDLMQGLTLEDGHRIQESQANVREDADALAAGYEREDARKAWDKDGPSTEAADPTLMGTMNDRLSDYGRQWNLQACQRFQGTDYDNFERRLAFDLKAALKEFDYKLFISSGKKPFDSKHKFCHITLLNSFKHSVRLRALALSANDSIYFWMHLFTAICFASPIPYFPVPSLLWEIEENDVSVGDLNENNESDESLVEVNSSIGRSSISNNSNSSSSKNNNSNSNSNNNNNNTNSFSSSSQVLVPTLLAVLKEVIEEALQESWCGLVFNHFGLRSSKLSCQSSSKVSNTSGSIPNSTAVNGKRGWSKKKEKKAPEARLARPFCRFRRYQDYHLTTIFNSQSPLKIAYNPVPPSGGLATELLLSDSIKRSLIQKLNLPAQIRLGLAAFHFCAESARNLTNSSTSGQSTEAADATIWDWKLFIDSPITIDPSRLCLQLALVQALRLWEMVEASGISKIITALGDLKDLIRSQFLKESIGLAQSYDGLVFDLKAAFKAFENKINTPMQIAKIILEKSFAGMLSNALAEIDFDFLSVKRLSIVHSNILPKFQQNLAGNLIGGASLAVEIKSSSLKSSAGDEDSQDLYRKSALGLYEDDEEDAGMGDLDKGAILGSNLSDASDENGDNEDEEDNNDDDYHDKHNFHNIDFTADDRKAAMEAFSRIKSHSPDEAM
ncbi:hypothetical protein BY996DRAFT_6461306 [Phakopsora pachyrhizi]|nr:hypothetical protein BY996DRAFT_6461306 [Phakopsora pachyrhizi]